MPGNYPTNAAEVSLLSGKCLTDNVLGSLRRPGVRTRLTQRIVVMAVVRGQASAWPSFAFVPRFLTPRTTATYNP